MQTVKLNCGIDMPIIGYGVYLVDPSVHKERMIQNLDTLDFTLTVDEMAAIRGLDTGHNLEGWPSDALKYNPKDF